MNNKVSIKELIECIELNDFQAGEFEEYQNYINTKTGELVSVPQRFLTMIENEEEPEELEEWEVEQYEWAENIIDNYEDYIDIPNEEEIKEYDIMAEFCYSYKDKKISKELCNAINGSGAFRRFKGIIYDKGIYEEWYEYRDKRFIEKIIEWCERRDLEYIDDTK